MTEEHKGERFGRLPAADGSPYPEIGEMGDNIRLARRLTTLFGGAEGELGTITRYICQADRLRRGYPEYAEVLMRIAKTEMRHLDIVGRLIAALGGEVKAGAYAGDRFIWWSGDGLSYETDPLSALISDIGHEQQAYREYITIARQSGDRAVFAILTRLALDEMIHAGTLRAMLGELRRG